MIKKLQTECCQPELVEGVCAGSTFKKWLVLAVCIFTGLFNNSFAQKNYGELLLQFNVTANGKPLLKDSSYINPFGETYQLSRLKYYVSNISLSNEKRSDWGKEVFLVETGVTDSISLQAFPGRYTKLYFTLGVDSALNCSGAQDGALDPFNGMFWTWNSGYIFFKMEGYSTASTADLGRIEHHVGGYRYPNNAARIITLDLPQPLEIKEGQKSIIHINVNLDQYWKGINNIKIADQALLMTPGGLAIKAADNFSKMFSISSVQ